MNRCLSLSLIMALAIFLTPAIGKADTTDLSSKLWVKLSIASESAEFRVSLPDDGCLSIISTVPGRRQRDLLWGPRMMKKGTWKIRLPASQIVNRSGSVELFKVIMAPDQQIGSRGSGERQFNSPSGLDYDSVKNEILVADTGNDRIIRLSRDGRYLAQHGGFGVSFGDRKEEREDSLDDPYDVAAGGFSNFYVSDHNNERVCIFDAYRSYRGNLYPKGNDRRQRLSRPRGIKVDIENNIWVVEGRADRVLKISASGDKLFEIGGFGWSSQQLKDPVQVDIGQYGEIYVADRGKSRIAVFDRLGAFIREITDHLRSPAGVAVDEDGLLLICDDKTNELSLYTPDGLRLAYLSQCADGTVFRRPSDIAVTSNAIFMTDCGNHRVISFTRKKIGSNVAWQADTTVLE